MHALPHPTISMRPVLALFFLLIALSIHAADLTPAETQALMKNLQEHRAKFPSLSADFIEERTSHLLNKPLTSEGNIAFQVPNKFRREVTGKSPSITVSNGQKLWIYYPNFKEAELYTLGQKAFFDDSIAALTAGLNFQRVDQFYTVKAAREMQGYRLALTPRGSGLKRMVKELTVWVDDEFKIDRSETILPKGDSIVTTYKNQRPTPLSPSIFDFTPPAEAHISQPLGK
ncbi:MAG: outer membrane lipoprotein carrier protein LolA [Chthoniobacter sp.]|nr:outer membrane lipoprotein carrier protein LolA [Chthoniobacter sp.]